MSHSDAENRDAAVPDPLDACAVCGAPLTERGRWYPTTKVEGEELRLYAFCSDDCRESFDATRP
jgi:predicted nucleic acid-binding Zn ribbon protein